MNNQVQLIAYVDRFSGGGLADLQRFLCSPLKGVFGGVHLLPFFHAIDGADAGFDPIDHTLVDPRLGSWEDVCALSAHVDIMADLIVNHVSSSSPQFLDYARNGDDSPYAGMFLSLDRVFPNGAKEADLLAIYRPRPGLPFSGTTLRGGRKRLLWTTFTPQQIDIDVHHPQGRAYLLGILDTFQRSGVRSIRLDAAGYAVKRAGTSCFMIPETYAFIEDLSRQAAARGIETLVEIHSHYQQQIEIAKRVDRVYDFALPPLILHALHEADPTPLASWLQVSPRNAITVLDTHDGIGVIDVGADATTGRPGLLAPEAIDRLVETIHRVSRGQSRQATGAAASNLDLYQVNCTYYDALGRDDRDYLLARALQFFAPGVPQVYYVGLLGGVNDLDLLARTRVGRDINRHYYQPAEAEEALARPMVQDLLDLIRFRNAHPAFAGHFSLPAAGAHELKLRWTHGDHFAQFSVNLRCKSADLTYSDQGAIHRFPFASRIESLVTAPTAAALP